MNKKKFFFPTLITFVLFLSLSLTSLDANAASPSYTITPSSEPYNGNMTNYSTYNSYTKQYYVLRSYLEQLEQTGGGTLTLTKGTYTISNTLYVPSNVTINLNDGVVINKGTQTGTSQFSASKSLFQLIRPSLGKNSDVYGGHNGEQNISFIGSGKAIIDMNFHKDGLAIVAGHNQNIIIENIQFENMYSGHFIEVDATKNIHINNNKFMNSYASTYESKEAINLDTPDLSTEGFNNPWSKFDKTANDQVYIKDNLFYNLDTAIGTHKYSGGSYHSNVVIQNNVIDKMRTNGIRVLNWANSTIENNTIKNLPDGNNRGILASGAVNPTFQNNSFENLPKPIEFMQWKNSDAGSQYAITYNEIGAQNINDLETNSVKNVQENFIRSFNIYNDYQNDMDIFPIKIITIDNNDMPSLYVNASNGGAKAYIKRDKSSGDYKTFSAGENINVDYVGDNWYLGYVETQAGLNIAFFHEDEVQNSRPFEGRSVYVSEGGAKAYQETSKSSSVYSTYPIGATLTLDYIGNYWYHGYINHNGKSENAYFHEDDVQGSKPFMGKAVYVSKGGANAYVTKDQSGEVYKTFSIADVLEAEYIGNNWYYGYIDYYGTTKKAFFHEDDIQGSKPFVGRTVYASKGGANAYSSQDQAGNTFTSYPIGKNLTLEYVGNYWYYGYINNNGTSTKAFFHEDDVQGSKPFVGKTVYVSKGGANAYKGKDQAGDFFKSSPIGTTLTLEYIGNYWYYGFIDNNGTTEKAFFHEDDVQGSKPFVGRTVYASKGGAKAYAAEDQAGVTYNTYPVATNLTLEYVGNYWYYGYINNNGTSTKAFFHEDDVQGSKPFVGKTVYVSNGGANAYVSKDQSGEYYMTHQIAKALELEYVGDNWYYGYINLNGNSTKAYFHEDNVQGSKPFVGRTVYVSEGGAEAYQETNQSSTSYKNYPVASKVTLEYIGNYWYYGYINHNGTTTKAFFHEDDVQGSKPFVGKTVYASFGGANAYLDQNQSSTIHDTVAYQSSILAEYIGNYWYYGFIDNNGTKTKVYFHEDDVQGSI